METVLVYVEQCYIGLQESSLNAVEAESIVESARMMQTSLQARERCFFYFENEFLGRYGRILKSETGTIEKIMRTYQEHRTKYATLTATSLTEAEKKIQNLNTLKSQQQIVTSASDDSSNNNSSNLSLGSQVQLQPSNITNLESPMAAAASSTKDTLASLSNNLFLGSVMPVVNKKEGFILSECSPTVNKSSVTSSVTNRNNESPGQIKMQSSDNDVKTTAVSEVTQAAAQVVPKVAVTQLHVNTGSSAVGASGTTTCPTDSTVAVTTNNNFSNLISSTAVTIKPSLNEPIASITASTSQKNTSTVTSTSDTVKKILDDDDIFKDFDLK